MTPRELDLNQLRVFRLMAIELSRHSPAMYQAACVRALGLKAPRAIQGLDDDQVRRVLSALFDADPLLYDQIVRLARQRKDAAGTVAQDVAR